MVHQPGRFYLIVEVEKEADVSVFHFLKEFYQPIFFEPTNDLLNIFLPVDKEYPFGKLHLQDSGQEFVETVGRVIGN